LPIDLSGKIIITKTEQTPHTVFDLKNGLLEIEGKIVSENPLDFFDRLYRWVEEYRQSGNSNPLVLNVTLEYFNTVASKLLSKLFIKVIEINAVINWYYEKDDEEIMEAGEDYKIMLNYNINIIERS
jgi:hypothetical protein